MEKVEILQEESEQSQEEVSVTALRDKCDRLLGLLQCLAFVVDTPDLRSYCRQPHHDLIFTIEEGIREIELQLRNI